MISSATAAASGMRSAGPAVDVRARLEQAEQEKRDLLAILQREREESTRKSQEIDSLLERNRDARQEISRLASTVQESRSKESVATFKAQGLEQQLQLTKSDAEWAHDQLAKVNEASAAFRVAKRTELGSLQAELESARQEASTDKARLATLQTAYDETTAKLHQTADKLAEVQTRLASQEDSFRSEVSNQSQLVTLLERRVEHANQRIQELEGQWEDVLEQCRQREEAAWSETEKEVQLREALEKENRELSDALDRLAEGVGIAQPQHRHPFQQRDGAAHPTSVSDAVDLDSVNSEAGDIDDDNDNDIGETGSNASTSRSGRIRASTSLNGAARTGMYMGLSPTADIVNRLRKSGKSFSQVYMELAKTHEELRRERLETTRLTGVLAQVMDELQDRAPQLQAQREETERLSRDLDEMLRQVVSASQERDSIRNEAQQLRLDLERVTRENGLLSQQLADFGRQVRELTKTLILRDDPSAADRLEDDGSALYELDVNLAALPEAAAALAESDTQAVITSELVTFRSLSELCAQNARLLQVTRQLGVKMEEEERNYRARLAEDRDEVVSEARDLIVRLEDEVRTERYRIEEVSKERDLFRQLCATGGRSGAEAASTQAPMPVDPASSQPTSHVAHHLPSSDCDALRARYDTLKRESDAEILRQREELRSLQIEVGKTTVASAREQALRQAAEDKLASLQRTLDLRHKDLDELTKRAAGLQESLARRDVAAQTAEEQLVESRAALEHLRTQVAHLQAERDLWRTTEAKLLEENRTMQVERGSLQELMRNAQTMQAELEVRGSDVKARLEQDVKRLEQTNEDLRVRLSSEQELYRQLGLRREIETRDLQSRIDSAGTELSNAREALAVARTSADHTQLRVEDLTRQLESANEKLAVYERRDQLARDPAAFRAQPEVTLSRAEQLEIELADLKAGRAAAQIEVQKSRLQVEEAAGQVVEKQHALDALIQAHDELKTSSAAELAAKASEIDALQGQVQTLTTELAAAHTQAKDLQEQLNSQRLAFEGEKKSLEDAITELGSVEERAKAEAEDVQGEIKKHLRAAKEAEAKLAELERIREALASELAEAREQLVKARQETSTLRSSKDLAEVEWGREKGAWDSLRQGLEREKAELQRRIDDLVSQNQILHNHLETISAQANEIRQAAAAPLDAQDAVEMNMDVDSDTAATQPVETSADGPATSGAETASNETEANVKATIPSESGAASSTPVVKREPAEVSSAELSAGVMKRRAEELHEVVKYLRREKEIVDLQMELNKQETARLKQSLEHVNKTLAETRTELDAERAKSVAASAGATHHAELLEKIKLLNELRESHGVLQESLDRANTRVAQLESQLSASSAELEPTREQLRSAQVELEAAQAQLNVQREEGKRWQARAQSLLQTHGVNEEVQKAEQQRAELQQKAEETQKQLEIQQASNEALKTELTTAKTNFDKLREQVRARIAQERKAVAEVQEKATALQKEKEDEAAKFQEAIETHEAKIRELLIEKEALQKQLSDGHTQATDAAATATESSEGATVATEEASAVGSGAIAEASAEQQTAAVEAAVQEATKQFETVRAQLEAENAKIAEARDRHLQKGREFLRNQRAAEAEVKARDQTIADLKKEFAESHADAIERAVQERIGSTAAGGSSDEIVQLRARVEELQGKLTAAETRIKELETMLAGGSGGAPAPEAGIIQLQTQHAEELRALEAALTVKYAEQQKSAVEQAFARGQQQAATGVSVGLDAGGDSTDVETIVQQRLKALEDERETAVQEAISAAVAAREQELKAQYDANAKARFEAGKNEANLRNQLMIKQKDNKIAKLTAEIAALKGEDPAAAAAVAGGTGGGVPTPAAGTTGLPNRPGVFGRGGAQAANRGGRGGATNVPVRPNPAATPVGGVGAQAQGAAAASAAAAANRPTPTGPAVPTTTSIRGAAAAGRGGTRIAQAAARGGRGGAQAAGAKRKLSAQGLPQSQTHDATGAGAQNQGAGAAKKPRPAAAPISIKRPPGQNQGQQGPNQGQ
ncbi:hypothetical protein BCV70DRAFT_197295 [Testicularia cyperi]|uniref:Uncharacterized protein n=1 Tax=Testicularia cyperi TaxID=1882483 RepID=A0A317Y0A4_9BASI|nr:hypothetical protein BCV70DRAFT_197295 [Testicularia cyperi]